MIARRTIEARRLFGLALLAAAMGATALACFSAKDEAVVQSLETSFESLKIEVDTLKSMIRETRDEVDDLIAKMEQFVLSPPSGPGQDYSEILQQIGARIQTLDKDVADAKRQIQDLQKAPARPAATPASAATPRTEAAPAGASATPRPTPRATPREPVEPNGYYYAVKEGETIESIAAAAGITADALRQANAIPAGRQPRASGVIWVPGPRPSSGSR